MGYKRMRYWLINKLVKILMQVIFKVIVMKGDIKGFVYFLNF